jgi:hypothetical protein
MARMQQMQPQMPREYAEHQSGLRIDIPEIHIDIPDFNFDFDVDFGNNNDRDNDNDSDNDNDDE